MGYCENVSKVIECFTIDKTHFIKLDKPIQEGEGTYKITDYHPDFEKCFKPGTYVIGEVEDGYGEWVEGGFIKAISEEQYNRYKKWESSGDSNIDISDIEIKWPEYDCNKGWLLSSDILVVLPTNL